LLRNLWEQPLFTSCTTMFKAVLFRENSPVSVLQKHLFLHSRAIFAVMLDGPDRTTLFLKSMHRLARHSATPVHGKARLLFVIRMPMYRVVMKETR
jgi:hypothetical protein